MNLLGHSAIGLLTPPGTGPIAAILRPTWTFGNWVYYTIKGDYETRKIHSPRVMFLSSLPLPTYPIPFSGISNGAYMTSIMEENPQIGLAIGDRLVMGFSGKNLEELMQSTGSKPVIRQIARAYNAASENRIGAWVQKKILGNNTKQAHDVILSYLMKGAKKKSSLNVLDLH